MTPDRWERILDVFNAAVERPAGKRAAFLEEACGDDADVRHEVEELLATYDDDPDFLETPAGRVPEPPDEDATPMEGQHAGPYRILRRLGTGGMGAVYLAVRDDDQYHQHVALKVVKRGMDSEEILRRFRHERQILASLDHPNVARLLDGGMTDDGRPYFVMEYVAGQPLNAYSDARRLSIPKRLALFQTVCAAVHYAHQNLVVHRDLKPSNILVRENGTVTLLDFGIAKLLDPALSPVTVPVTRTDVRLMTPEYASPEQVRGETITTASDVYQLGVLLYELLTGQRPFHLKHQATDEVARIICEEEPTKPSTAVRRTGEVVGRDGTPRTLTPEAVSAARATEPEKLRRRLAGDLDTIVLKALHKEPARRYASSEALADDVQRYLDGRPIVARPDTVGYRVRMFVRRNRVAVVAAMLVAVSLLLGLGGTAWQARVAMQERDRAQQETEKARQVTDFMLSLFESADPVTAPRDTVRVRDVLEAGAARAEDLDDQPAVQAQFFSVLSKAYRHLGRPAPAAALEEQALAIRRSLYGDEHPETAFSLYNLGLLLEEQHQPARAAALFREAAASRRAHYGEKHPLHLNALYRLALTLHMSGQSREADSLFTVWELGQQRATDDDDPELAATLGEMGTFLQYTGRLDDAEALLREAVAMSRRLYGDTSHHVGRELNALANVLLARQQPGDAEAVAREALAVHEVLYTEGHYERAESRSVLGEALLQQDRFEEAEPLLKEALVQFRRLYGKDHPVMGRGYVLLAQLYHRWDHYDEAEPFYRNAIDLYTRLYGEAYPITVERRELLADLLTDRGDYAAAERILLEAYQRLHEDRGTEDRYTQDALRRLVRLYETWERPVEAAFYQARLTAPRPS